MNVLAAKEGKNTKRRIIHQRISSKYIYYNKQRVYSQYDGYVPKTVYNNNNNDDGDDDDINDNNNNIKILLYCYDIVTGGRRWGGRELYKSLFGGRGERSRESGQEIAVRNETFVHHIVWCYITTVTTT